MIEKSANQLYKESGSTESFLVWLKNEKENASQFIKNQKLTEIIEKEKEKLNNYVNPKDSSGKVFGLSKNVLILSSVLIISAISFKIYQHYKK